MSIGFKAETAVEISRNEQRLGEIDDALSALYKQFTTANLDLQEYSIAGSRSVKRAEIAQLQSAITTLEKQRKIYEARVLRERGYDSRTHADHSGNSNRDPSDVDAYG